MIGRAERKLELGPGGTGSLGNKETGRSLLARGGIKGNRANGGYVDSD